MLKKWLCATSLVACMGLSSLHARTLFLTPVDATNTSIAVYTTDPLSFAGTINGPTGAFQVIEAPQAGKYYAIGRTSGATIGILQGTAPLLALTRSIPLLAPATAATLSPDGRRLIVLAGGVHVLDTTSDALVTTGGAVSVGATPIGVVALPDSTRAIAVGANQVTIVDINLGLGLSQISLTNAAKAVSIAPNGSVYVSAQDAIYEIETQTLSIRATITLRGSPGPLTFTPDGRGAVAANTTPNNGVSAYYIDLSRRRAFEVASNGLGFDEIVVANNTTAYAVASGTGALYSFSLTGTADAPISTPVAYTNVSGIALGAIRDIAISTEATQARYLFLSSASGVARLDLQTGVLGTPIATSTQSTLSFTAPPSTAGVATVALYNNNQTVVSGQAGLPLVVRAIDSQGNAVFNAPVTFTSTTPGLALTAPTTTTGSNGYAATYLVLSPALAAGTYTVNATAGSLTLAPFSITISATGSGGTGGNGGTGGTGGSTAGALRIVAGQGQVVSPNFPATVALTVEVRDAQGNLIPNTSVSWAIISGLGSIGIQNSVTDATGRASTTFVGASSVAPGTAYEQAVIRASTGVDTVTFYETTVAPLFGQQIASASYQLTKPVDRVLNARTGEFVTGAIEATVTTLTGLPIPNVALRLGLPGDSTTTVGAMCRDTFALSNASGVVSCDVIATGPTGTGFVSAFIGEAVSYALSLNVVPGAPGAIQILSGNNQSGTPGQALNGALAARLTDASGTPLSGVDVVWEVVTPGTATLRNTVSRSDGSGLVSTLVTLGSTPGPVQVRVRAGTVSATFALTINSTATQLQATAGNTQTAIIGQAFANAIQVRLADASNNVVSGAQVNFAVTSGSATLSAQSAITNAQGIASVLVTAGQTAGPVTIQATAGNLSTTFNLTVRLAGPVFTAANIVNGASFQAGVSPGSIATIFVTGIAPNVRGTVTPPGVVPVLPTRLSDVEVLFNGINAPIYSVSNMNGQESVTVQVPFELNPGTASVTVRTAGGATTTVENVAINAVSPGVFETNDFATGARYAVAYRADGSLVTSANPARRGDLIRIFATGLGQVANGTGTNRIGAPGQAVNGTVIVGVNNAGVRLVSADYLPGAVGLYVITFEVPADAATGTAAPIGLAVAGPSGNLVFANGTALPIQ